MNTPHISVCICTFRRPAMLTRLLLALERQQTGDRFTFSIVVADNDTGMSGRDAVAGFAAHSKIETSYCSEPRQNIALARNRALEHARGDYVAWIDDDEFPVTGWLQAMLATCEASGAAGVLGPVRPHFDAPPPRWVIAGRFCERPEHPTGTVMHWSGCRTGNVLFRRDILKGTRNPFRAEFGTGGEDVDFFRRMALCGHVFVWCNEGVAYEAVPPSRWTRRYMLRRALLRGRNTLKLRGTRAKALLKSAVAVPAYSVLLPGTLLFGHHVFMKYSIKFCDHLGRVLALLGINPVKDRPM
jgi:succinoglycan biosynthesis protein ExoM